MSTCQLLLLLLLLCACAGWSAEVDEGQFERAMRTLNASVHFLHAHPALSLVLRTHNGIINGQLKVLLERMTKDDALSQSQLEWLRGVQQVAQDTTAQTQALDEPVFGADPWRRAYPSRLTDPARAFRTQEPEVLSEREFSYCSDQISGTNKFQSKGPCSLSPHCWSLMTVPDRSPAYLTQQLLYLSSALNRGCEKQMSELSPDYQALQQAICATLQPLAMANVAGQLWEDDVYTHMLLCGMLGFRDFFTSASAHRLPWWSSLQMADGCIGDKVAEPDNLNFFQKLFSLQSGPNCLIDRTAMVASLMTQYLHFFLEDPAFVS